MVVVAEPARRRRKPLTLTEAAAELGVSTQTLRRWADAGRIPVLRTLGGRRRFRPKDIEAARQQIGFPADEEES
jgi:excisionase family DNA binding protein